MSVPPVLLAVVPCESLSRDPATLRFSLDRIIGYIAAPAMPHIPSDGIGIYVAVTEVVTPTRVAVHLVNPDGTELPAGEWDIPGGEPLYVYEFAAGLGVEFYAEGRYSLRVSADGDMLGEWRFLVGTPRSVP